MFATYVQHPFRSDRAGVGKGSISIWFGKHFHSIFSLSFEQKKTGLHDQTSKFKKKKRDFSSEQNLISPGFHSKSLTAILCWGGCLSALSLLSKVKTGPKWRARHVCGSYRILEAGQGRATVGIGAQRDTFPILLDSDGGGTTRPQPQCCILHKIYYILWFQAQANSKILISHTQIRTRYQNPSKGCASQALFGVKNFGL